MTRKPSPESPRLASGLVALCIVGAAAPAGPALAATAVKAATSAAAPGVCIFSRETIFSDSAVGKYVGAQLRAIADKNAAAGLAEQGTLGRDAAEQNAAQRQRDLATMEREALSRMLDEATPIVSDLAQKAGCGVVLDANSVLMFMNAKPMNLTPGTITRLDAKITQIPLEPPPQVLVRRPAAP